MKRGSQALAATLGVALGMAVPASADPRAASTGWYAEGGLGAVGWLPSASDDAKVGPAVQIRAGRDLFSWLSIGVYAAASSHLATVPAPPSGEWFQLYRGGADVRVGGRIGRIALFVEGGAGGAVLSSNVLDKVMISTPGKSFSIAFDAGVGLEYQLLNRHYAVGLAGDAFLEPQFDSVKQAEGRLYLRYTY